MPVVKRPMIYIGVDPGSNGAIAYLYGGDLTVSKIPETDQLILELFSEFVGPRLAVLEKVGGYIGEGERAKGSRMFKFGVGYGVLRMGLTAAAIPFEEVVPQTWIKKLGLGSKGGRTDPEWKSYLYQKAQQLFPSVKFPKYAADAVLIAEFCRRKSEGKL